MPTGMVPMSGALAPPDNRGAGMVEWSTISGARPEDPNVGGPYVAGLHSLDVDRGRSQIVTLPGGSHDPATAAGVGAPGLEMWDDWRDLFNFKGSPMPWLLILSLVMLGFMDVAFRARVGPATASASVG